MRFFFCYGAWLLLSALGLWLIFALRVNLIEGAVLLRANPWALRAIDRFGIYILGLVWLGGVIALEDYLRVGVGQKRLLQRIGRICITLGIIALLSYGLQWLAQ